MHLGSFRNRLKVPRHLGLSPLNRLPANASVFWLGAHRLDWAGSEAAIERRLSRWLRQGFGSTLLLLTAALVLAASRPRFNLSVLLSEIAAILAVGCGLSLFLGILLGVSSLRSGFPVIRRDRDSGLWEMLRLTPLRDGQIVQSKHALAQLGALRLAAWLTGMRAALMLLTAIWFALFFMYFGSVFGDGGRVQPVDSSSAVLYALRSLIEYLLVLATAILFIIEPLHRMRAFTAIGLAISTTQSRGSAVAALGLVTFGLFVAELMLFLTALMFTLPFLLLFTLTITLMGLVLMIVYLAFYSLLQSVSYRVIGFRLLAERNA
jgi:fumarate reductase subunit D